MAFLFGILGHFLSQYNTYGKMEVSGFHTMPQTLPSNHTPMRTQSCYSLVIYEGIFIDGLQNKLEGDLGGQSVAVLDHRLSIRTIPAVH